VAFLLFTQVSLAAPVLFMLIVLRAISDSLGKRDVHDVEKGKSAWLLGDTPYL
jgi:hypothetical protein